MFLFTCKGFNCCLNDSVVGVITSVNCSSIAWLLNFSEQRNFLRVVLRIPLEFSCYLNGFLFYIFTQIILKSSMALKKILDWVNTITFLRFWLGQSHDWKTVVLDNLSQQVYYFAMLECPRGTSILGTSRMPQPHGKKIAKMQ